ncbi:MAG TPA: trypsin-like peptidase domain-containing protein [Candidatus Hydrogenedentes bacterium]|nr:trypsin-like peptidase domain-containing protein [Candidatus Hydrogenedentota bacterium]
MSAEFAGKIRPALWAAYRMEVMRVAACVLALAFVSLGAIADDDCNTCSEPQFPEAATYLEAKGYPAASHTVLLTWSERTATEPSQFVTGYHVKRDDGSLIDLYSDGDGNLLNDEALSALGIRKKNWDLPPVEKLGESTAPDLNWLPDSPTPVSVTKSVVPRGGVVLPEIDWAQVAQEDQESAEHSKGATRIGVFVDLESPIVIDGDNVSDGSWVEVADGSLWSFAMMSPDALGMRVHFAEISLPAGARVVVYNGEDAGEAYGPYFGPSPDATDLWSATVFGESVVVECYVPRSANRSNVRLTIDRVTHNYIEFGALTMAKGAGNCNLDITCYSSWSEVAKGVAGVGSIGSAGSIWCTGSLLADTDDSTTVPYFLTANHCVSNQSAASNIEVYWLYQTASCNGAPPSLLSVPRTTGGATMLATNNASTGTDFALMRLNNNPPAGVNYLGWTSSAAGIGTPTTCVHHPSGDFKRLTFGDVTNVANSLLSSRPRERYHQSTWRPGLGVTEPGSSGSPLFIESTQQIIGQLWGGPSSCTAQEKLDYYGRFDVSYPLMEQYLDPDVTIDGEIEVTVPNSQKTWLIGTKKRIKWTITGNPGATVKIDLYKNGVFLRNLKSSTPNDGKAPWKIKPNLSAGNDYYIRVTSLSDGSILDNSDTFALTN